MEKLAGLTGRSVDSRAVAASLLRRELSEKLTSFSVLHVRLGDRLRTSSESFTLTGALHEMHEDVAEKETFRVMSAASGVVLGAACGGICGGVGGALGAVGAVTYSRLCDDINAVGATFGFLGGVLGGAVGGASCGAVGGAVGASAAASRNLHTGVSDFLWISFGLATGGAIGSVFGGKVGAAGGAFGGAFGTLCAVSLTVGLVGGIANHLSDSKDSKEQKKTTKKANAIKKTEDFSAAIEPLVELLKTIKSISDKMASSEVVKGVAAQTAKTLASVAAMEKTFRDCQSAADLPQFVSSWEEAARRSKKVAEELKTTREEVEKVLLSLNEH